MFVTILTIIYLALAMFILIRFLKQSVHFGHWMKAVKLKVNTIFGRKSDIDNKIIDERVYKAPDRKKEQNLQPEFRRS
jgi:hypothetical protein